LAGHRRAALGMEKARLYVTTDQLCGARGCELEEFPDSHKRPPHNRVATVTDVLEQNVPLEDVQHLAGHADPRTTRLYDRRRRKVTRNIVEQISI
jgi:integrase